MAIDGFGHQLFQGGLVVRVGIGCGGDVLVADPAGDRGQVDSGGEEPGDVGVS
nr:hypothetical protein [Acrocarpospora macrocephala]